MDFLLSQARGNERSDMSWAEFIDEVAEGFMPNLNRMSRPGSFDDGACRGCGYQKPSGDSRVL